MQRTITKKSAKRQTNSSRQLNLQAALRHAENGLMVFPAKPDKRPYLREWQSRATTKETTIHAWWDRWPDAIPALPTGKRNGVAVMDIDRKNGKDGFKGLAVAGHDTDKLTLFRCDTPSGGTHLYFQWPPGMGNSAVGLPSGVDVRGEGGYVIAPGAVVPTGEYQPSEIFAQHVLIGFVPWPKALLPGRAKTEAVVKTTGLSLEVLSDALFAIPNDNPDRQWWVTKHRTREPRKVPLPDQKFSTGAPREMA